MPPRAASRTKHIAPSAVKSHSECQTTDHSEVDADADDNSTRAPSSKHTPGREPRRASQLAAEVAGQWSDCEAPVGNADPSLGSLRRSVPAVRHQHEETESIEELSSSPPRYPVQDQPAVSTCLGVGRGERVVQPGYTGFDTDSQALTKEFPRRSGQDQCEHEQPAFQPSEQPGSAVDPSLDEPLSFDERYAAIRRSTAMYQLQVQPSVPPQLTRSVDQTPPFSHLSTPALTYYSSANPHAGRIQSSLEGHAIENVYSSWTPHSRSSVLPFLRGADPSHAYAAPTFVHIPPIQPNLIPPPSYFSAHFEHPYYTLFPSPGCFRPSEAGGVSPNTNNLPLLIDAATPPEASTPPTSHRLIRTGTLRDSSSASEPASPDLPVVGRCTPDYSTAFRTYSALRPSGLGIEYRPSQARSSLHVRHAQSHAYGKNRTDASTPFDRIGVAASSNAEAEAEEADEVQQMKTITPERVRSICSGPRESLGLTSLGSMSSISMDGSSVVEPQIARVDVGARGTECGVPTGGNGIEGLANRVPGQEEEASPQSTPTAIASMPWSSGGHRFVPPPLALTGDVFASPELMRSGSADRATASREVQEQPTRSDKEYKEDSAAASESEDDRTSSYQPSEDEGARPRKRRKGTREVGRPGAGSRVEAVLREDVKEGERRFKGRTSLFLIKLNQILQDPAAKGFIDWSRNGDSILIKDVDAFSTEVLPRYMETSNFDSFARQLHTYKFSRRTDGRSFPRRCSLTHPTYTRSNFAQIARDLEEAQAADSLLLKKGRGRRVDKHRITELEDRLTAAQLEINKLRSAQEERARIRQSLRHWFGTSTPFPSASTASGESCNPSAPPPPSSVGSSHVNSFVIRTPNSPTPSSSVAMSRYPSMMGGSASDDATVIANSPIKIGPVPVIDGETEMETEDQSVGVRGQGTRGRAKRCVARAPRVPRKKKTSPADEAGCNGAT